MVFKNPFKLNVCFNRAPSPKAVKRGDKGRKGLCKERKVL